MRPVKLMMQAFGPYAEKEVIDFTKLENRTMFVISGKTGSGKTTIFDGISFAIYGKASSDERSGPELRSKFAASELLTEVELTFTLRNNTYTIYRSPQQEKKKSRGDGYTTVNSRAELYIIDENGEKQLIAANVREVDSKILDIMQIDSNQFRQIVMIPQGDFQKLLFSESKDKEVILQRLFHTQFYKKIEEKLKEEATFLRQAVEEKIKERLNLLKSIHVGKNNELEEQLNKELLNVAEIMSLLTEDNVIVNGQLKKLQEKMSEEKEARDKVTEQLLAGQELIKQFDSLKELEQLKEKLASEKDIFQEKEYELQRARKASLLEQQEQVCQSLNKQLKSEKDNFESIKKLTIQLSEEVTNKKKLYEAEVSREQERTDLFNEIQTLKLIEDDVKSFSALQTEVVNLQAEREKIESDRQQAETTLKETKETLNETILQISSAEKSKLKFSENKLTIEKLTSQLRRLTTYNDNLNNLTSLLEQYNKAEQSFNNEVSHYNEARNNLSELEQQLSASQAAQLASKLEPNCACPVCGSKEHPQLATNEETNIPSEADLKNAKINLEKLEKSKAKLERAFIEIRIQVNNLQKTINDEKVELSNLLANFSDEIVQLQIHEINDKIKRLNAEQTSLQEHIKTIEELEVKRDSLIKKEADLNKTDNENELLLQKTIIELTEKETALRRMMASIPENLRSVNAYEAELDKLSGKLAQLNERLEKAQLNFQGANEELGREITRLETVEAQLKDTTNRLNDERQIFLNNLKEKEFTTYEMYNEAKRSEKDLELLEREIRNYREQYRSVSDRYVDLAKLLENAVLPNIEELQEKIKQLDQRYNDLHNEYTALFASHSRNKEIAKKVAHLNKSLVELELQYELIGDLADVARGQNVLKMTFERYVLASFLDEILVEANVRLNKMTSGRYKMIRKTDRSKGNVQSGLELLVFDQYTGQERHVKTLSGGESFKASLSLALGLADIVQSYAGGVSLETMFIDEGFGTLDPESLDQAIEALLDIQSSGRLVGVISHVPELKERIDAQLEVIASQTGSTTKFHLLN